MVRTDLKITYPNDRFVGEAAVSITTASVFKAHEAI